MNIRRLIRAVNILHMYFSLFTLSVHSHSLILRCCMIPDYIHHPMICLRRHSNCGLANGLVMISACCSFVSIWNIFGAPNLIWSLKWCHFTERCFVRGLYSGSFDNSISPLLSSKVLCTSYTNHISYQIYLIQLTWFVSMESNTSCFDSDRYIQIQLLIKLSLFGFYLPKLLDNSRIWSCIQLLTELIQLDLNLLYIMFLKICIGITFKPIWSIGCKN